jgi:hypothetical protein
MTFISDSALISCAAMCSNASARSKQSNNNFVGIFKRTLYAFPAQALPVFSTVRDS